VELTKSLLTKARAAIRKQIAQPNIHVPRVRITGLPEGGFKYIAKHGDYDMSNGCTITFKLSGNKLYQKGIDTSHQSMRRA
jgi:hypothetical protein